MKNANAEIPSITIEHLNDNEINARKLIYRDRVNRVACRLNRWLAVSCTVQWESIRDDRGRVNHRIIAIMTCNRSSDRRHRSCSYMHARVIASMQTVFRRPRLLGWILTHRRKFSKVFKNSKTLKVLQYVNYVRDRASEDCVTDNLENNTNYSLYLPLTASSKENNSYVHIYT